MKNSQLPVIPSFPVRSGCHAAAVLVFAALTWWAGPLQAAGDAKDQGVRLLQAQLPAGATIPKSDCETLAHAVDRATTAHRNDAPAILKAALTNGNVEEETLRKEDKRSCECVAHIVRASVQASPAHASEALEMATALYPECAEALAAVLDAAKKDLASAYDFKDFKDHGGAINQPVAGITSGIGDPASGLGPGFPGAPGFGGSSPSGGFALPPPSGVAAVTSVLNQ